MFARKLVVAGIVGGMLMAAPMGAQAGGLFGEGGLIRGDVGRVMAPVQRTILTPVLQATVVVAATGVAAAYAGPAGAPIGAVFGNGVNDLFAGKGGEHKQEPAQQQAAMGGNCATDVVGTFPLAGPAPIGSACSIKLPNGKEFGGKVAP